MVKKQKNFNWWFLILAVVAIVALVLAAIAFSKANMTGQGIFNFKSNQPPGPLPSSQDCQIKTSADCYEQTLNFSACDSCEEICEVLEMPNCDYAGRGRFEGNFTAAPHYYEPRDCDAETSTIQFRIYCNCCDE